MAGQNTLIISTDYNTIQSKIQVVLGIGSSDFGYNQAVLSSQVTVGNKISVTQWNNLRTDLLKARQHQSGLDETSNLVQPAASVKILNADRAAYSFMADVATTNRLVIPPIGQATRENLVPPAIRTSAWNGVLTHIVTVNFVDYNTARAFFNAGGLIECSASRAGGSSNIKNTSWSTLLTNMGRISFGYTDTTVTGSGSSSLIGFYDLTTSDQLVFTKATETPTYSPNAYRVYARIGASSSQVIITIQFRDDSAPGGYGIDENIDGTLTSTVQVYRASGVNVSVGLPPATSSGI
jgi:hypothetical protein